MENSGTEGAPCAYGDGPFLKILNLVRGLVVYAAVHVHTEVLVGVSQPYPYSRCISL